jgi:GNAT superfamily N-acetyltransferase
MSMDFTIRLAQPGDAHAIADIQVRGWQATYGGHLNADWLASLSAAAWSKSWEPRLVAAGRDGPLVAESAGHVVGFASFGPVDPAAPMPADYAELYTLYVEPSLTSHGIGAALLAASERAMALAGYSQALLWCYEFNARARRFYERHGWTCDGTLRSYEAGPDAIRYVRELGIETAPA